MLSANEKELYLRRWLVLTEIKAILVDCDDTICGTRQVFRTQMSKASLHLANEMPILNQEAWGKEIERINNIFFEKHGVIPERWNMVVSELAEKYTIPELVATSVKGIFGQIYRTRLEFLPEAEASLKIMSRVSELNVVTHADENWTWRKYKEWLMLDRFISWKKNVFTVNPDGHKTEVSWRAAMDYFERSPSEVLVIGDSPRSDIMAAIGAGVKPRNCFLLDDENQWSVHQVEIPGEVRRIKTLDGIFGIAYADLTN